MDATEGRSFIQGCGFLDTVVLNAVKVDLWQTHFYKKNHPTTPRRPATRHWEPPFRLPIRRLNDGSRGLFRTCTNSVLPLTKTLSAPMNTWYSELNHPPLTPPNWIFGPVWAILYLMIATSIILFAWRSHQHRPASGRQTGVWLLIVVHLVSNFIWTPLFFALKSPGWALIDIAVLDLTLVTLIVTFWRSHRICSILLWPYLVWVGFATYLNAGFFLLNRN